MRKENIPVYADPEGFEDGANRFPCDTQYMKYNPLLHRYTLTLDGLLHHGIDISGFQNDEWKPFTERVSKKVYDYIQHKAGHKCYHIQMFRIATAPTTIYPSQYFMRKQFEEALADQASFMIANGDTATVSRFYVESNGRTNSQTTKPEEVYRDISDIAPECMRTLETLGLTRWFVVNQIVHLDPNSY